MTSYHNHTVFSDGKATAEEMVRAAAEAGLAEVGISDHVVLHPEGKTFKWAMPPERLDEYVATARAAAERFNIPVRVGVEADFFPETAEATRRLLAARPFDFLIGSVHFAAGFLVDAGRKQWAELNEAQREEKWTVYWHRIRDLARSGIFDFVAHLDVPKRFGFKQKEELPQAALDALDEIARSGMAVEINTAGWTHKVQEAYPSPALLREACRRKIPTLINADAHAPQDIAQGFGPAKLLAREAGYSRVVRYEGRRRRDWPL
ncbi:MAG: histidinol-phosphatase HisJ family protein [Elusimicrobia bacterium]|nr:histidinol-phosphatase HisJ family protein [Elusimicrobiota bacterium]